MDRKCENGKPVLDPGLVNATKKIAPTAAARIRSTSRVCIFKHLRQTSFDHSQTGADKLTQRHAIWIALVVARSESLNAARSLPRYIIIIILCCVDVEWSSWKPIRTAIHAT